MKKLLPAAIIFCGLFNAVNSAIAQTWTQLTNAPSTNWNSIAISADGSKLVAVAGTASKSGPIYTSTDMGATWLQQTNTQQLGIGLKSVASSADGSMLATALFSGSHNYISTNSGLTWMLQTIPPNVFFIAISPDGERLFAPAISIFYISTNFGVTWATNTVSGAAINTCSASSDGSKIIAGGLSGSVYTSTNSGITWKAGPASGGWPSVASSADGSKFAAAPIGSSITGFTVLTSTNSGHTWTTNIVLDNLPVHHLASSADGNKLIVAGSGGGGIYTSANGGINWITNSAPNTNWVSVASSTDGNTLVAAVNGGGIWISQTTPTPLLNIVNPNSNLALSWLVPSTNFVLQQNSDLTTTNWVTLTNTPTLNLTNLQNQVMLSPSNSSGFFRLMAQ